MEIYICFIRDNRKGTDFTTVSRAFAGQHLQVKTDMARKHPAPDYTMLTTLTLSEMEATMKDIKRWCGITASMSKQPPMLRTA